MTTQTSLMAQQIRIQQWVEQIRECQSRPRGMEVETWCAQNNLTKANYYYRLRRVREVCMEQFQTTENPTFVELPVLEKETVCAEPATETTFAEKAGPVLRIKSNSGLCIEVFSDISPTLLRQVIEAMNHADASGFKKVYLVMVFTDLRRGIDGLVGIMRFQFNLEPYDKNTLFLFCGRRCDRIKALLWEGDISSLPRQRIDHYLSEEELTAEFGEKGWK